MTKGHFWHQGEKGQVLKHPPPPPLHVPALVDVLQVFSSGHEVSTYSHVFHNYSRSLVSFFLVVKEESKEVCWCFLCLAHSAITGTTACFGLGTLAMFTKIGKMEGWRLTGPPKLWPDMPPSAWCVYIVYCSNKCITMKNIWVYSVFECFLKSLYHVTVFLHYCHFGRIRSRSYCWYYLRS